MKHDKIQDNMRPVLVARAACCSHMQPEYDFSNAERGKFFARDADFRIPVYLESESLAFVEEIAQRKGIDISDVVNDLIIADRDLVRRVQ